MSVFIIKVDFINFVGKALKKKIIKIFHFFIPNCSWWLSPLLNTFSTPALNYERDITRIRS